MILMCVCDVGVMSKVGDEWFCYRCRLGRVEVPVIVELYPSLYFPEDVRVDMSCLCVWI